jgi:hypothetical protein
LYLVTIGVSFAFMLAPTKQTTDVVETVEAGLFIKKQLEKIADITNVVLYIINFPHLCHEIHYQFFFLNEEKGVWTVG